MNRGTPMPWPHHGREGVMIQRYLRPNGNERSRAFVP